MDGLFGDGLVDVLCCGGDSLEEDLRWGPRLGALVDLVEFDDGVTKVCSLLEWSFIISINTSWDWFQRTYVLVTARKNL